MTCVVVTIGGAGDFWRFASVADADNHPIYQHGDAIMSEANDIPTCFRDWEYPLLASRLGDKKLSDTIARISAADPVLPRDREYLANEIWAAMTREARVPPTDPAAVIEIVRQDRIRSRTEGVTYRKRRSSVSNTDAATTEAPKKGRAIPREPKHADTTKISMGKDKDGNVYGPENNPKRPGSAAHATFAKYVDGMTVGEAKAAGIGARDIDYDNDRGFITLS